MTDATALEEATRRNPAPQPAYGYYRQTNGWITVSPATDLDELKYRREGWEALTQYGRVEMASEYAADHPLETLFMMGGAKELPAEQIIQMALHLNPPLVPTCRRRLDQNHRRHTGACWQDAQPVSFPQLSDWPAPLYCTFCNREFPTPEAKEQHEGVAHKDEKGDIRTGEVLAEALVKGLKGSEAEPSAASADPYLCGRCNEGFNHPIKLAQHFKNNHKEEANEREEGDEASADSGDTGASPR